jgi:hypothetical protein
MRRFLIPSVVVVLALLIAVPSFALEVKYSGLFRARVFSQHDFTGWAYPANGLAAGGSNTIAANPAERSIAYTQHNNRMDQRLRMYFDFISSENLKVVARFETQAIWGKTGGLAGASANGSGNAPGSFNYGSGNVGADSGSLNVKNVYVDFKIPGTPLVSKVGIQGIALIDSWVIDSDFSAAVVTADLKPFTVTLGYVAGQNFNTTYETDNVDDLVAVVSYKDGPFNAALVGLWQDAHNTPASVFGQIASVFDDPLQNNVDFSRSFNSGLNLPNPYLPTVFMTAQNNNLFDLGIQLGYKLDYLSAYLNFVKNFGSVKLANVATATTEPTPASQFYSATAPFSALNAHKANYTGWMIDAGVNYFCGPFTANVGGFYTSGQKLNLGAVNPNLPVSAANPQVITPNGSNIDQFSYPLSTSKYFSEIMGGGIMDNVGINGGYWRGYPNPTNIYTATVGGAWQALPQTKLALSYWYFGTSQSVPSKYNTATGVWSTSSNLGHEIDLNITQNIVDKLNLDLVGAYMFTGEAFRASSVGSGINYGHDNSVYELGARLQWAF